MSADGQRFGELRSLAQGPTDEVAWLRLCQALSTFSPSALRELALPYALDMAKRWPDQARIMPWGWLDAWLQGREVAGMRLVRALHLGGMVHDADLWRLAQGPALPQLQWLNLRGADITSRGFAALVQSPLMGSMRGLWASGQGLGAYAAQALADSTQLGALEVLELSHSRLREAGAQALFGATNLPKLRELTLANDELPGEAFAREPITLGSLRVLGLEGNPLRDEGLVALSAHMPQSLRELRLDRTGARDAGVSALVPMLRQVSTLSLRHNQLSDVGACALSAHAFGLSTLRLGGNMIGARGVLSLSARGALPALERLELSHNRLGARGAQALAKRELGLRALRLSGDNIADEGARALADSALVAGLELLDLSHCALTDAGGRALAQAHAPKLERLMLSANALSDDTAHALAHALAREGGLPALRELVLDLTSLTARGREAIEQARPGVLARPALPDHHA